MSMAQVAIRDDNGHIVLELNYLTNSLARVALDQIKGAIELSSEKSGSKFVEHERTNPIRPFLIHPQTK
jgi:hypothetical protein